LVGFILTKPAEPGTARAAKMSRDVEQRPHGCGRVFSKRFRQFPDRRGLGAQVRGARFLR
jgi:hypothetical protein